MQHLEELLGDPAQPRHDDRQLADFRVEGQHAEEALEALERLIERFALLVGEGARGIFPGRGQETELALFRGREGVWTVGIESSPGSEDGRQGAPP